MVTYKSERVIYFHEVIPFILTEYKEALKMWSYSLRTVQAMNVMTIHVLDWLHE